MQLNQPVMRGINMVSLRLLLLLLIGMSESHRFTPAKTALIPREDRLQQSNALPLFALSTSFT